jgi:hypothetical protein
VYMRCALADFNEWVQQLWVHVTFPVLSATVVVKHMKIVVKHMKIVVKH